MITRGSRSASTLMPVLLVEAYIFASLNFMQVSVDAAVASSRSRLEQVVRRRRVGDEAVHPVPEERGTQHGVLVLAPRDRPPVAGPAQLLEGHADHEVVQGGRD